jgi:hypothetical protein
VRCAELLIFTAIPYAKEVSMNTKPATYSRKEGIVTAIGVLVLLLGTATGNAYAMLAMAVVALATITVFYGEELGRKILLAMALAAGIATVVALAIARF